MRRFVWILALCLAGCAGSAADVHPEAARLAQFVADFRDAAAHDDADAIYEMLGADAQSSYTKAEFRSHFARHKSLFTDYGRHLQDAIDARAYEIYAHFGRHPCGRGELVAHDQTWLFTSLPEASAFEPAENQKKRLAAIIRTHAFTRALKLYADAHPEWRKDDQRQMQRAIMFGAVDAGSIAFRGNHAIIDVGEIAKIDMVCTQNGWRIEKCISHRSTK